MVDLGGSVAGESPFNIGADFRALLQSVGFRVARSEDLELGAESVVVQCMVSAGESRVGIVHFAYYQRVYHWDARQRSINPVWEAFGLATSDGNLREDALLLCTRDLGAVLKKLGYGT
jgi:hypothetical protein